MSLLVSLMHPSPEVAPTENSDITINTSLIDLIAAKADYKDIVATFADVKSAIVEPPKPTPSQRHAAGAAQAAGRRPAQAVRRRQAAGRLGAAHRRDLLRSAVDIQRRARTLHVHCRRTLQLTQ